MPLRGRSLWSLKPLAPRAPVYLREPSRQPFGLRFAPALTAAESRFAGLADFADQVPELAGRVVADLLAFFAVATVCVFHRDDTFALVGLESNVNRGLELL